ncbi:MAG: ISKra4 family transposase [Planctomycetes bacterium]|nr:ISKra4 family transposase [Planctomycetota bacterium]
MTEIIVKIPAHLKGLARAMELMVDCVTNFECDAPRRRTVDYRGHERALADAAGEVERQAHVASLSSLDQDADRVLIDGVLHVRVLRDAVAEYKTRVGAVPVARSLFRPEGQRNAKTVNTVTLRSGAIEDEWLPDTASAMAYRLARGTSREAEQAAEVERTLPYSHSSFEKIGHAVGKEMMEQRVEIEEALIAELAITKEAHSISVALDRTSMPMEESRPRPVGRPRKGAAKRPIEVVYRMAWTGTVTLHDDEGKALHTIRYGRMPHEDGHSLAEALASDALALCRRCPRLEIVTLGDGAEQIQTLLATHVDEETFGCAIRRLIDLWHVLEKLGDALKVIEGDEANRKRRLADYRRRLCTHRHAPETILSELRASGREDVTNSDCPVHAAITYFENQGDLMAYVEARRDGLPVGSGNVEATCKSLFGLRMKRPGARWKTETGGEVITMRAHLLSDRWNRASEIALPAPRVEIRAA